MVHGNSTEGYEVGTENIYAALYNLKINYDFFDHENEPKP